MNDEAVDPQKALYLMGSGYCNAAIIVRNYLRDNSVGREQSVWIALQNLLAFALEAALKSYLMASGHDRASLSKREYGHELRNLFEASIELGIKQDGIDFGEPNLFSSLRDIVNLFQEDYSNHNYRYLSKCEVRVMQDDFSLTQTLLCIQAVLNIANKKTA